MANIKSSKKSYIKSKKLNKYNSSIKSMIKTFIKKTFNEIKLGNKKNAINLFKKTQSNLDRQSNKKIIHKNKASRYKSNLSLKINKMK